MAVSSMPTNQQYNDQTEAPKSNFFMFNVWGKNTHRLQKINLVFPQEATAQISLIQYIWVDCEDHMEIYWTIGIEKNYNILISCTKKNI